MTGFRRDKDRAWVAKLSCLHTQHIRHQPPFWEAAWIEDDQERSRRVGQFLDCPFCDHAEMPDGLAPVRTSATWDATTVPDALRRAHRITAERWGLLEVEAGEVRFQADTRRPRRDGHTRAAPTDPPGTRSQVEPGEGARFT